MKNLMTFVREHTGRGTCRCERCLLTGEDKALSGHTADLVFFDVSLEGSPTLEGFFEALRSHRGVFGDLDPLDGREHGYIELGGWVGDQDAALRLMGLGALLGVWELLTPYTMLGPGTSKEIAMEMAGGGLVTILARHGTDGDR